MKKKIRSIKKVVRLKLIQSIFSVFNRMSKLLIQKYNKFGHLHWFVISEEPVLLPGTSGERPKSRRGEQEQEDPLVSRN